MKEKLAHYPAAFGALFLAIGIWLQYMLSIPPEYALIGFVIFLVLASLFKSKNILIYLFAFLLLLAGTIRFGLWQNNTLQHPINSHLPLDIQKLNASIVDPPKKGGFSFVVDNPEITAYGEMVAVPREFLVRTSAPIRGLKPGDQITLQRVSLEPLSEPRNPGQFNYKNYLQKQGVMAAVTMQSNSTIHVKKYDNGFHPDRFLYEIRESLSRRIKQMLPAEAAHFLTGILLGMKQSIPEEIKSDFQKSGVAHVLAISGLHVGFVVLIIFICISFLPFPFRVHNILTILALVFYMLLTGAKPPVVRATIMISIYLIGKNMEKKPNVYNTVFIAAMLILLIQPQQLFWVGFQFSFVAVLAILFFYQLLKPLENKAISYIRAERPRKWLHRGILIPFFVSVAAQLGTIPLVAVYFHKIPLISFILNLIVIPLVGLIVPLGFLTLALSFVSEIVTVPVAGLLSHVIEFLIHCVHVAANLPLAYIQLPDIPLLSVLIYLLALWLLFTWHQPRFTVLRYPAAALMVIGVLWLVSPKRSLPEVIMLDVGQGEATLVRTAENQLLLFDAGTAYHTWDSGEDVIFPALQHLGSLHLDKVFISHPHADHLGGMFSLIDLVSIDSVYLPDLRVNYFLQDSLMREMQRRGIPFRRLRLGDRVAIDKHTQLYVLAPFYRHRYPSDLSGDNVNNTSLVGLLKMGETAVLFTGDAEQSVERRLSGWDEVLRADILKIGHHGSHTSSTDAFLTRVSPSYGIIPVGRKNRYGHPSPYILQRLQELNVRYYRTDQQNAVWLRYRNGDWHWFDWW